MSKYRANLPQLGEKLFLSDGGLETTLVFHDGLELPHFAACALMRTEDGRKRLTDYYERYIAIAADVGYGFILEAPTWRASADWGLKLGYSPGELAAVNRDSIALLEALRARHETAAMPMVISGCVGPRGDGYDPGTLMSAEEAGRYHAEQIGIMADAGADMITAITMTNTPEAIGVVNAARDAEMPVAISFTVETDGRLPTGQTLGAAIDAVDEATTASPVYYMINCAHPTHFPDMVAERGAWLSRVRGLRANASRLSHAELDCAPELDPGDPAELGEQYRDLVRQLGQITVLGGCCGTDHRHIGEIAVACRSVG